MIVRMVNAITGVMCLFNSRTNKYCGKVGKYECLYSRYQQLKHEHKYSECYRYRYEPYTGKLTQCSKNKYHGYNAEDNDVPSQHIGKKTYGQCNRLDEQGNDLNGDKQELNAQWNAGRIQQMTPEMFVRPEYHYNERYKGQAKGNGYVAGEISAARQQAQQVIDPDKEKDSE